MKRKRFWHLSILFLLFVVVPTVAAHPLGNFTVSRYSRLTLDKEQATILYIVDMAEIPAFQERQQIDRDGDDVISNAEETTYLEQTVLALAKQLALTVNGTPLSLQPETWRMTFPPGQGDLPTLRLEMTLTAVLPQADVWQANYQDNTFVDRLGWQEIVVQAGSAHLIAASAPSRDVSQQLQAYPGDLLQDPLAVREATFTFAPTAAAIQNETANEAVNMDPESESSLASSATLAASRFGTDEFADLLTNTLNTPGAIVIALTVAFGLGAAHALTPGHGKTIVGAYLVGSRGTAKHALFLGLTTTVTHTAGVFGFGLLVLFASRFILPEQLYPWLGVASGLLVVIIGFSLLRSQLGNWRGSQDDHEELDGYHTHFGIGHTHTPQGRNATGWRNLLALGVSGGLLPCPSALILLLSAIALQKVGLGLVLIVAFSIGLASILTGIGLALVYAGRLFEKIPVRRQGLLRRLPVASAAFITIVGLGITVQALIDAGVF